MAEPVRRRIVAVSHKAYLSHARTLAWLDAVAPACREVRDRVDVVVLPVAPELPAAVERSPGAYEVGAQDVSEHPAGAYTGEVPAELLAEIGVGYVEVGHAERRFGFGETAQVIGRKLGQTVAHGLLPLLCVGEGELGDTAPMHPDTAASEVTEQVREGLAELPPDLAFVVAYEPVWAIGADQPAGVAHILAVSTALREQLSAFPAARLIYGGTAGLGLFAELGGAVDGLFLGRRGHDPAAFGAVLAEVREFEES